MRITEDRFHNLEIEQKVEQLTFICDELKGKHDLFLTLKSYLSTGINYSSEVLSELYSSAFKLFESSKKITEFDGKELKDIEKELKVIEKDNIRKQYETEQKEAELELLKQLDALDQNT